MIGAQRVDLDQHDRTGRRAQGPQGRESNDRQRERAEGDGESGHRLRRSEHRRIDYEAEAAGMSCATGPCGETARRRRRRRVWFATGAQIAKYLKHGR